MPEQQVKEIVSRQCCECEVTNLQIQCDRHQCSKSPREVELCRQGGKYWTAWENCTMPMQECFRGEKIQKLNVPVKGGVAVVYKQGEDGVVMRKVMASQPPREIPTTGLPGTKLKAMLAKVGIKDSPGCGCRKVARQMDEQGPDWCEEHIEEIVDKLEAEAGRRRGVVGVLFSRIIACQLIKSAVKQAHKETSERD